MELATPAKFDVYDEPSNVAHRWERYVKSVKLYLTPKGINSAQRQRAILLHCAGSDVQDIADNNITDTGTDFTTLVRKLIEYFAAQNNVVFERYQFRLCTQLEGERVDSWYTRLRIKAQMCEYENQRDSIIRDQIVACCSSTKLRRKLLETPNISLQETLKTARTLKPSKRTRRAKITTQKTTPNSKNSRLFVNTGSQATNGERNRTGSSAPGNKNSNTTGNHRQIQRATGVVSRDIAYVTKPEVRHVVVAARRITFQRHAEAPRPPAGTYCRSK